MANSISIEIELDESGAVKGLKRTEKEAERSGKKAGDNYEKGFAEGLANITKTVAKVVAVAGAVIAAVGVKESIAAAIQQEEAVNSLNTSLSLAGSFSRAASQDIQNFASQLQQTTTVGDETTLALFGLARNLTKTNEEAKRLTEGAIQLSAATGMSLDSSVKNLGKSLGGLTGELGESLPAVKQFSAEQLKAGAALDFVLDRFGGAAEAKVQSFAGAIKQLSNAYGDSLEQQGFLITKSPLLIAIIQKLTKFFESSAKRTKQFADEVGDIFKPIANGIIKVAGIINRFLIQPLELAFKIVKKVFGGTVGAAGSFGDKIQSAFKGITGVVKKVFSQASVFADIAFDFISEKATEAAVFIGAALKKGIAFIKPFATQITGFLVKIFGETNTSLNGIVEGLINSLTSVVEKFRPILEKFGFNVDNIISGSKKIIRDLVPEGSTFSDRFDAIVATFDTFKDKAGDKLKEIKELIKSSIKGELDTPLAEAIAGRLAEIQGFVDNVKSSGENLKENLKETVEATKDSFLGLSVGFGTATKEIEQQGARVAGIVRNSLGKAIAGSVQLLVSNLMKGKNAFADFGKFVLGVFGDLAIQLGQFFIIQGIAVEALKTLGGAAAVAAGVALVALGTLLKGVAGGGGAATASTGGTAESFAGGAAAIDGGAIATGEPEEEKKTTNQIIVQGDVFDSEETGLRIFDIISEQSEKNGNVIIGGAFA